MEKEPITLEGLKKIKKELEELKNIKRPKIIEAIAEARAHGDLKENAEYHAAKDQQGFIEARIREIEAKLSNVQEVDVTQIDARGKVIFGSTIDLLEISTNQEITYKIVGEDESDIKSGLISYTSPIARALIGKTGGDEAIVDAPAGEKSYEIIAVRYI